MSTVQLSAVVPEDIADALRDIAERNDRSIAAEIRLALRAHVDMHLGDQRRAA